jgi:hypothetical protein
MIDTSRLHYIKKVSKNKSINTVQFLVYQDDHITLFHKDTNPNVLLVTNIKVPRAIQDVTNLFVFMKMSIIFTVSFFFFFFLIYKMFFITLLGKERLDLVFINRSHSIGRNYNLYDQVSVSIIKL